MNLLEKIEAALHESMKAGNKERAETFKMLKSDLMYERAKTGKELSEDKMLEVTARAAKRRKESIEEFRKGNREDLASKEEAELKIIGEFLPKQMVEAEVEKYISEKVAELGGVSKKDLGRVMGGLMKELKGKADGNLVKTILSKKVTE